MSKASEEFNFQLRGRDAELLAEGFVTTTAQSTIQADEKKVNQPSLIILA